MIVYLGSNELKKAYIGSQEIKEIWVGNNKVFPKGREPGPNTIAFYKLEDNANDFSGNGRNGTPYNVTYATKDGVKSAYFNGNSSRRIDIPGLGTLSSITVSLRASSSNPVGSNTPFSVGPSTDNANLQIYDGANSLDASRWNGSNSDYLSSGYDCTNGKRHHILVTNGSNGLRIYADGALRASSNNVRVVKSDNGYSYLGYWRSGPVSFEGYLSNVIIENKVRTLEEIQEYYNNLKSLYGIS